MKRILLIAASAVTILALSSCSKDALNTSPTDAVSSETVLTTTDGGMRALNGTIRWFWAWGQTTGFNHHQSFGPQSYALMGDLMGEDMVMSAQGNGWFWNDYIYNVKPYYTNAGWRPYDCWNYYYTLISNVNYILAAKETMEGAQADVDYIMGNCYAFRAYAYHYLAMTYARSYIGHEDMLSVPIYTEPTVAGTPGKARSTNREVYARAMTDIDSAIVLLQGQTKKHVSHINYETANGIKARIALYMGDYQTALEAAQVALAGGAMTSDVSHGYNDCTLPDVMWGAEIIADQGTTNPQFLAHMDPDFGGYGDHARKCCSPWLYNRVAANDIRKAWWNYEDIDGEGTMKYQQWKFQFGNKQDGVVTDPMTGADHIFMRVPEMMLTLAECQLRTGDAAGAEATLNEFMSYRQPGYDCTTMGLNTTDLTLNTLTTDLKGTLLEEILIQRRIELWGEFGRIYDIKRLRQGFDRSLTGASDEGGHPITALLTNLDVDNPESFDWVLTIPQAELDANPLMVQNPIGSAPSGNTGDDPSLNPAE